MTLILGKSVTTAEQLSSYLLSVNKTPKFSRNISAEEFCQLYIDIGNKEGVRGDLACVQCFKETDYLKYGGDVLYTQNNFAGLGTTGNGVKGCIFPDIETGILAHIQHLKTYATKSALNEPCVDTRRTAWFVNAKGGTSPTIEGLGGTWAVPGYDTKKYKSLNEANKAKDSYGYQIVNILNKVLKIEIKEENNMSKTPVIALSAGHGLYTKGKECLYTIDPTVTKEWFLNDRIMDKVEYKLKEYKCNVVRVNDTTGKVDTPLATRANKSDSVNADVYLAMHHNAGINGKSGGGTVIYYYSSKAERKTQAQALYNAIVAQTGLIGDRSSKVIKKSFYECREPKAPAFLVENGYMDSVVDTPIILSEAHAEKTAIGVVNFLVNMLNLQKSGVVVTGTVTSTKPSTLQSSDVTTYTVQKGDTLSGIGKKTGVNYLTIAKLNGLKSPYILKVGQVLKIRETKITTASSTNYDLVFNATYYANAHADLKKAFGYNATQLLNHFKSYGMKEGRRACGSFDVKVYKANNADLQKAFGDDYVKYFQHYLTYGHKENRKVV